MKAYHIAGSVLLSHDSHCTNFWREICYQYIHFYRKPNIISCATVSK